MIKKLLFNLLLVFVTLNSFALIFMFIMPYMDGSVCSWYVDGGTKCGNAFVGFFWNLFPLSAFLSFSMSNSFGVPELGQILWVALYAIPYIIVIWAIIKKKKSE